MSQPFASAYAEGGRWEQLLRRCLDQIGEVAPSANLGFIYVTDQLAGDFDHIVNQLKAYTGITHWVGTVGIGICAGDQEYYETNAMAVMLAELMPGSFRVFQSVDADLDSFREQHRQWWADKDFCMAVVHGDPRSPISAELIPDLAETLPQGFLVGGLSSANGDHSPQYADGVCEGSLSGVLLSPEVGLASTLSQGCSPIGPVHQVSNCQNNILISLDDRPALEVFQEDIGEILARDLNRVAGYIFVGLPITGSDRGDYKVRNLMGIDPTHQVLAIGDWLEKGQTLMFCRRDGRSAREDLERALNDLKRRLRTPIRGALYFSCLGRGRYLFGEESQELKTIHDILGDFPLVGFFANGEISHNQLYGYTGVLTVFT